MIKQTLVTTDDLTTMLNMITYEYYARLYRRLQRAELYRRPYFEEYYNECKKYVNFESIDIDVWRDAYDFIADLFDDNEAGNTPCDTEALFDQRTEQLLTIFNK